MDLPPGKVGMVCLHIVGNPFLGLGDDLEATDDHVLLFVIAQEGITGHALAVLADVLDR
jgi:hypothetical protein